METIVVGVDGSSGSFDALDWAAQEALLRGAALEIVLAVLPAPSANFYLKHEQEPDTGAADKVLAEALERVHTHLADGQQLEVRSRVIHAETVPALIEASGQADLLVVGYQGRGAFSGMLLGSASLHCATNALCPVVIVRPNQAPTPTG